MNFNLEELKKQKEQLKSKLDEISGRILDNKDNINNLELTLEDLKHDISLYKKSVEVLNLVQEVTKEKTKNSFERLVTYALRFIYSKDYRFQLEFGRRGNLTELNFNIKSPEFEEYADPIDTEAGGILDILSLALRISLLELNRNNKGFIVLDEPFKHLSKNHLAKAEEFLETINKKINRQIILITHQDELINNAEYRLEIK